MDSQDDIFLNAREIADPAERATYLAQACGADDSLRERVAAMLRDADEAQDFFGAEDYLPGMVAAPLTEGPGTVIGRYELLQKIGEGGMGAVYLAEQREPVVRKVALKIIKLGMDTRQVLGRFEAERQALALMDHPNIAKILDGGATDTGRPYFVMDLVQGLPITRFCDEANLSTRNRLDLFLEVCSAIQHAHQKGIIHRDIKPANILVTLHGDKPVSKVIDFGIAKATQGRLTDKTLFTQFQHFIGTPAYMSPEQASLNGLDVDTRSDIYGLGVLLYELLTGRTPFDEKELMKAGFDEMRSTIREREPLRPSTRLSSLAGEELTVAAKHQRIEAPRLIRALRGDLDWIAMKALEKDRARRYETANGLAADLKRHLNNEPVIARPPSTAYRLQKTLRRNKVFFAAASAVALTLIAGLSFSTWSFLRERKAHAGETAQRLRAEEAVTSLELQRVEDLLEKDEIVMGVAYLSRIVRQQPTNRSAAQRLLSALTQRNFALPVGSPLQHAKKIIYAEFSPDGRRAATASLDFTARIWDARTGEPLTPPKVHPAAVRGSSFSPDGQRLLTFADDFQARLWDVETGRALGQPMSHTNHWIGTAEFSPDGRRVVTASDETTVRIWDGLTGQPLSGPIKHHGVVRSTHFRPDGRQIVTACEDGTAQVWDTVTAQPVAKPFRHGAGVTGAEFSPEGNRVVTSTVDCTTCVWDIPSGEPLTKPLVHASYIATAKFSQDGERIIVSLHDGLTRIFNARDWAPLSQPMQHRDWTTSVEFGPESQRVLSGSLDNTARLWDAESGEPLSAPMQHDGLVWSAHLSPDGLFAVTASADGTARLWRVLRYSTQRADHVGVPSKKSDSLFLGGS